MRPHSARSVRLFLEELESRLLPSALSFVDTFESALVRTLPSGWSQWASSTSASYQVTDGAGFGSNKGLVATAGSTDSSRAWATGSYQQDVQVQADIFVDSLAPTQVFARGTNLNTATPTYYALSVTRGMEVTLQSVVNGQTTTLAKVTSASWVSSEWVRVTLSVNGNRLEAQIFRADTGQYLTAQGAWQSTPVKAISLQDTKITAAGWVGLARPAKVSGSVKVDNFRWIDDAAISTPTSLHEQDFASNLVGGLPSGWSSYTNTTGQNFQVSATGQALSGSAALTFTGSSSLIARSWYNTSVSASVDVSAAVYIDSLSPAQIFGRGQDLSTATPDYYAVSITRGAQVQLVRVLDGVTTTLGSVTTGGWLSQEWLVATLSMSDTTLRVQIYRPDTGQYLTSGGTWQVTPTWAIERTDATIRNSGRAGVGRAGGYTGGASFDNFVITTSTSNSTTTPTTTTPTTTTPTSPTTTTGSTTNSYNFDTVTAGTLPSSWSSWTRTNAGGFQVAAVSSQSTPNGLVSTGGSDVAARAWYTAQSMRDVQISSSVYLDGLTPAELIVRGSSLSTASPTYYAVSITRGLRVQIIEVVNGTTTIHGTVQSDVYASGLWVNVTLRAVGSTLQAYVQRVDTKQYLAANGTWQTAATAALTVSDTTLSGAGYAGVNRPASYSGRVLLDNLSLVNLGTSSSSTPTTPTAPTTPTGGTTSGSEVEHYSHIRVAELAYYGTPLGDYEKNLLRNSVDLVVSNTAYLDDIDAISPNTAQLIYTNVSNIYLELLSDWLTWADKNGVDRESAFYHVNKATSFTGDSSSSRPVNWFWSVQRGSDAAGWTDMTSAARQTTNDLAFASVGQSLVLGYTEKFRELNVALKSGAGTGWTGVIEYASAVDAAGTPTAWKTLQTVSNTTSGFRTSGTITFDPPSDWKTAVIDGSERLYYVRIRTTSSGTAPVATTLLGRDYVRAGGRTTGTIPAFDSNADSNRDGYLDDREYATRRSGFDARFVYESRAFYPNYGQMRFATNVANTAFRNWVVDYSYRYLNANPKADGLFVDNSFGKLALDSTSLKESLTSYSNDYASLLAAVNAKIAPRWVLANTAGAGSSAEPMARLGIAYLEEFALRPMSANTVQFEDMAAMIQTRATLSGGKSISILDTHPQGGSPTDSRTMMASLAYYYLVATPTSYLMFNGGYEPATTWSRHWIDAVKYNVGSPAGSYSVFATGLDPANRSLTYKVYQRTYQNALVLYKPLSYASGVGAGTTANTTATTHSLGGTYRVLNADGTLGATVTSITLRNGEAAILVKQ